MNNNNIDFFYYATAFDILPPQNERNGEEQTLQNNINTNQSLNIFDILPPVENQEYLEQEQYSAVVNNVLNSNIPLAPSDYYSTNSITRYINLHADDLNSTFFPTSILIESMFNDYLNNKNKLNDNEYSSSVKKIKHIKDCPICFNTSDKAIKIIKCSHEFCENCIKKWLKNHKNTCPVCRTSVIISNESNESNESNIGNTIN